MSVCNRLSYASQQQFVFNGHVLLSAIWACVWWKSPADVSHLKCVTILYVSAYFNMHGERCEYISDAKCKTKHISRPLIRTARSQSCRTAHKVNGGKGLMYFTQYIIQASRARAI